MSVARGFGINGFKYFTNVCKPIDVNINFITDSANGNGLGIRSLKSNGFVEAVFMHTSAPLTGSGNPNPPAGYAVVRFKNNFNYYLGGFWGQISPLGSTGTTSVTTGSVYAITTLGTTTAAQWLAAGLPAGFTPAVGASFVAIKTGAIGGTGTVGVPGIPTNQVLSVIGDPNATIANLNIASNSGAQLLLQFNSPTNSSTTTLAPASPTDGTVVAMCFRFDGSSVTVDGL